MIPFDVVSRVHVGPSPRWVPPFAQDRGSGSRAGIRAAQIELPIELDELRRVLRRHGVRFALVHGSHAQGTAGEASDVDLGVWAQPGLDLRALAGDLPEIVGLVDVRRAPDGLAGRIALTGVVVLDDDPVRRVRWQADTCKRYRDDAPRREALRRDFVWAHGWRRAPAVAARSGDVPARGPRRLCRGRPRRHRGAARGRGPVRPPEVHRPGGHRSPYRRGAARGGGRRGDVAPERSGSATCWCTGRPTPTIAWWSTTSRSFPRCAASSRR